ncbi:MAG: LamG-like jellyroll fold domain-containing protein [Roseibacillus sp.]
MFKIIPRFQSSFGTTTTFLVCALAFTETLMGQLSSDLTAYWTFDNSLDDVAGSYLGNANTNDDNLTFQGTGAQYGTGLFGAAGYTSAGQGYASTPDSVDVDANNNTISISVWTRVENFNKNWQTLLSKGEGSNFRISRYQSSNFVNCRVGSGDFSSNPFGINDGQWHHIVTTGGPSGSLLYIDGVLANSNTSPAVLSNDNTDFWIGDNPEATGRQWDGEIDDVALWHRELSAAEVTSIYQAGTDAQGPQSLGQLIIASSDGDNDDDGLPDEWEFTHGLSFSAASGALGDDGASGDPDGDSLSNLDEYLAGTNPVLSDTDQDGLWDGAEVNTYLTDPTLADSDSDGSPDGEEILFSSDPNDDSSLPAANENASGLTSVGGIGPYLDGNLPSLTPNNGNATGDLWSTANAFPALGNFGSLKGLVSEPLSNNLHVIERGGTIQRVDVTNPTAKVEVLNISALTVNGDNGGLRSVVFHPEFNEVGSPNRNYMYCFYSTDADASRGFTNGDGNFFYRLSRFTRNESSGLFPSSSELVLIQQSSPDEGQHFGGSLGFDPDGFLLIGWGDMEFNSSRVGVDFYQDAQRVDRIFQAAVLRIDVDMQGGAISSPPTRTLQGSSGPNAAAGTDQSCPTGHAYYHVDNFSGIDYYIPSDNYFVLNPPAPGDGSFANTPLHGDALGEHMALGTRNPWRMAVDPVDGDIALFNVGSNSGDDFEEVELVSQGYNGGWPYLEGLTSQTSETGRNTPPSQYAPTALGTETSPITYWAHGTGRVASGGLFYRGSKWSTIDKHLIFGDHGNGKIWALDYKDFGAAASTYTETDGALAPSNYTLRELVDSTGNIRQMAAGPSGEDIYIATSNQIHILTNAAAPNPEPPALLSATGAFTDLANLVPRGGLIPYQPASQLWSDRAAKLRWIAVPNNEGVSGEYDDASQKITYSEEAEWAYPIGTVFIKHFALPSDLRDPGNAALLTPVETRFAVRNEDGDYYYFSYRWRADGSDADLIPSAAETAAIPIISETGQQIDQIWEYPSRPQCFECHQTNAGNVLGMKSRMLNSLLHYPSTSTTANQLTTFASLGLFDQGPDFTTLSTALKSVAIDDLDATWEHRVRSYLDSNCSYCHRPGSDSGRAEFDALLTTPLGLSGIIDGELFAGHLGVPGSLNVTPGAPSSSVLYLRDSSTDPSVMMPPLGRSITDEVYIEVLKTWIETMDHTNYIAWAQANNIDTGFTGDADGDGYPNVFEFLFLQDGKNPDISTLPEVVVPGASTPLIQIPVSGSALSDGFQVVVQGSTDLENWFPVGHAQSGLALSSNTSAPETNGMMEIEISTDADKQFIRYGVTLP